MPIFWKENWFVWLLIVGVAGIISKSLYVSVNFFMRCDPVRVYVVVIVCFGSLFLIFSRMSL